MNWRSMVSFSLFCRGTQVFQRHFLFHTDNKSVTTCSARDEARHLATNAVHGLLNDAL